MKNIFFSAISVLCALVLLPLGALSEKPVSDPPGTLEVSAKEDKAVYEKKDTFRILIKESGKIEQIDADTYITGVVAAEMPALYETEALKAQAVAAYTYALRKRNAAKSGDYDLTDDPDIDQCYISADKMQEKWGDKTQEYKKKIEDAVKAVSGRYLEYDGAPALTVYHALSYGTTESCKNVWGSAVDYLVPVDSSFDKEASNYLYTVKLTEQEMGEKLKALCDTQGEAAQWFSNSETTKSGRVTSITVCGSELTGAQIADALSLPSAAFSVSYADQNFTVESRGRGHGVGMSQYGADRMAKSGKTYKEILLHYYTGCKLK